MKEIIFVTGNKNKKQEIIEILGGNIEFIDIDLVEIQELDIKMVLEAKAIEGYNKIGKPVIVEDTSLIINDWNGLPGPLIKWFMKSVGNKGILKMIKNFENREAIAITYLAWYDGLQVKLVEGSIKGTISEEEKGENGFGWDAIFIPNGSKKTFAQMNSEEKNQFSMRKLALSNLK
ncbi:MAG: RdgB/HAM1 family non-canonical purine NTP pyrophosphatase [Patescibacteria group bacterium]